MEKINISKLLKDCPTGYPLDCSMYEDVYFDFVDELNIIHCYIQHGTHKTSITFNQHGTPNSDIKSKCVIFPIGKTTWEEFVSPLKFKDGDILFVESIYNWIVIYKENKNKEDLYKYVATPTHSNYTFIVCGDNPLCYTKDISKIRFATEEEKSKLFKVIKDSGYKWNAETKTLEDITQPNFKVGAVIQDKDGYKVKITEVNIEDECYGYESMIAKGIGSIAFREQDDWELVPNKFDINTLVPFESKVLVRHNKDNKWTGSFFSFIDRDLQLHCYKFVTTADKSYPMMIPYKGNEYLLGKTDDCQDFYKIWE